MLLWLKRGTFLTISHVGHHFGFQKSPISTHYYKLQFSLFWDHEMFWKKCVHCAVVPFSGKIMKLSLTRKNFFKFVKVLLSRNFYPHIYVYVYFNYLPIIFQYQFRPSYQPYTRFSNVFQNTSAPNFCWLNLKSLEFLLNAIFGYKEREFHLCQW